MSKPYEFTGFGALDVTKPYEFIGFGAQDVAKPYEFIGFGALFRRRQRCNIDAKAKAIEARSEATRGSQGPALRPGPLVYPGAGLTGS